MKMPLPWQLMFTRSCLGGSISNETKMILVKKQLSLVVFSRQVELFL